MKIVIVAVDKLREAYIRSGCALYEERLQPLASVSTREVRAKVASSRVKAEGQAILSVVAPDDCVWALDQGGKILSSFEVAQKLAAVERSGRRRLVLAIGGAEGLSDDVLKRADFVWSLSRLTFLHEMARLLVLEQLYRAIKINRGEPYHK